MRETFEIRMEDGALKAEDGEGKPVTLTADQYVSMNMWGFPPKFIEVLEKGFPEFLAARGTELKSEYLLPTIVDKCIQSGEGSVKVLPTHDKWFGVTYQEDRELAEEALRECIAKGLYPEQLYR